MAAKKKLNQVIWTEEILKEELRKLDIYKKLCATLMNSSSNVDRNAQN